MNRKEIVGIDTIASSFPSAIVAVCENLAQIGAVPGCGELDSRVVWDGDDAIEALSEAISVFVRQ